MASRNIHPVGSVIGFQILLVGGEVALAGQGKVSWLKEYNPAEPTRPYGMGVQFTSIDAASRPVLGRILRAKEASGQSPRRPSGANPVLATAAGHPNGKPVAPPVDTTVDLSAEFGLDDAAVRRAIDRTRMSGVRGDDDLGDLLKTDPLEPATLAQALAELPRLLDTHASRRRASGGFRPVESTSGAAERGGAALAPAVPPVVALAPAANAAPADGADPLETTNMEEEEATSSSSSPDSPASKSPEPATVRDQNGRRRKRRR